MNFGTIEYLKCLDSREEIYMKTTKIIIFAIFALGFFGCGTTGSTSPNLKGELPNKVQIEKAPNPEGLRHFMDGQMMLNQGDFAMAILEFQQAVELDPDVGAIHTSIAECYWNLGKPELAEKHLVKALTLDSNDEQALKMLADQYILQKNYAKAQESFRTLQGLNPNEARYLIALGELEKVNQNYSEALNYYLEAFELEPSRLELLETSGRFALQLNDFEQARSIFKRLVYLEPNQSKYINMFMDLVMNSKKYNEGIDVIHSLNGTYGESTDRMAQLGLLLYKTGKPDEALNLLETVIKDSPNNPNFYFTLFDIYMDARNIKKASKVADQLIVSFPEDWRGYYSRSLVYMDQKEPQAVIALLKPVSDTFAKIYSIQYLLGLSHNQMKQFDEAEEYLSKALTIRPGSPNVLHTMAILYDEIKNWEKSDEIYIQLIKFDSSDAQAFNNYAYSLVERNEQFKKALELAKKAIDLEPENPSYLDTIGWIYFKLNNVKKARQFIEASIKITGDNAVVLEHLGDVFMKNKKPDKALNFYKRALNLDKNNERLIKKVASN